MKTDLFIRNPHSILPILQTRPQDVIEVVLPRDQQDPTWAEIAKIAKNEKVKVREMGMPQGQSHRPGAHKPHKKSPAVVAGQGNVGRENIGRESAHGASIKPKAAISVEEVLGKPERDDRGIWLALDCLQDPQNLGAIFRSASFFGVRGILMTQERSVPMTSTVYDIASGGVESVPFASVINLQRAFEKAKDRGLWILGTSEHAKSSINSVKADRPWLVVVGNEENGMRRLTSEACDELCTIPGAGVGADAPIGTVTSLNVSVATGVVLAVLNR